MTSDASWTGRRTRVDAVGDSQCGCCWCCCGGGVSCRVESSRVESSWCRIQVDLMQRRLAQ